MSTEKIIDLNEYRPSSSIAVSLCPNPEIGRRFSEALKRKDEPQQNLAKKISDINSRK